MTSVGLAKSRIPDYDLKGIRTTDDKPGGLLQWDPETHRVRVCDTDADHYHARGEVFLKGHQVEEISAAENGNCDSSTVASYDSKKKYTFKICLGEGDVRDDAHYKACKTADSRNWDEVAEDVDDPCDIVHGPVEDYCSSEPDGGDDGPSGPGGPRRPGGFDGRDLGDYFNAKKPDVPKAPEGKSPSVKDSPDADLPRFAQTPPEAGEPFRQLLGWLVWAAFGACMAGIVITGGNMAIKHKRGELGAHATGLGWVAVACIVGPAGAVIVIMHILIHPT